MSSINEAIRKACLSYQYPGPSREDVISMVDGRKLSRPPCPTKFLVERIRARDWDAVRHRTITYPWDARYRATDSTDATPLHVICLYRAPRDVVELVVNANPEALVSQDSEGWTPLHVALLHGDDDEVVVLLIRRGGLRATAIKGPLVGTPIHLAFRHGSSTRIIKELLDVNPAMATTTNEHGAMPARILWYQSMRDPQIAGIFHLISNNMTEDLEKEDALEILEGLIEKLIILVSAAKGGDCLQEQEFLLHHLFLPSLGDMSPFIALAVYMYSEQLECMDHLGNLPLHAALSQRALAKPCLYLASQYSSAALRGRISPDPQHIVSDPAQMLLRRHPCAARVPNREGRLPIHLALSCGGRTWRQGIADLIQCAPETAAIRDEKSKLYPFQIAATANWKTEEDNIEILETVYQLLLQCPHLLHTAVN